MQPLVKALIVAELMERVKRRQQEEIVGRRGEPHVQDAGLLAGSAVAAVEELPAAAVFGAQVGCLGRGVREREVDSVFDCAAVAGAGVRAPGWPGGVCHGWLREVLSSDFGILNRPLKLEGSAVLMALEDHFSNH